ncbi:MAG: hypothetical protein JXQ73_02800 [Phycisphaerae bacterium]|nr:hypothetical protein [Phycisphaerae bacterium]
MTSTFSFLITILTLVVGFAIAWRGVKGQAADSVELKGPWFSMVLRKASVGVVIVALGLAQFMVYLCCRKETEKTKELQRVSVHGLLIETLTERTTQRGEALPDISGRRILELLAQGDSAASNKEYARAAKAFEKALDELIPPLEVAALAANNLAHCRTELGQPSKAEMLARAANLLDDRNPEYQRTLRRAVQAP